MPFIIVVAEQTFVSWRHRRYLSTHILWVQSSGLYQLLSALEERNICASINIYFFHIFTAGKSRQISTEYSYFVCNHFRCFHHVHQIQQQRNNCIGKVWWKAKVDFISILLSEFFMYKPPADRLYLRPFLLLTKYYVIVSFRLYSNTAFVICDTLNQTNSSCSHVADIARAFCFIAWPSVRKSVVSLCYKNLFGKKKLTANNGCFGKNTNC